MPKTTKNSLLTSNSKDLGWTSTYDQPKSTSRSTLVQQQQQQVSFDADNVNAGNAQLVITPCPHSIPSTYSRPPRFILRQHTQHPTICLSNKKIRSTAIRHYIIQVQINNSSSSTIPTGFTYIFALRDFDLMLHYSSSRSSICIGRNTKSVASRQGI